MTSATATAHGGTFLPGLTRAFSEVDAENPVKTADFAKACLAILPIFDHLGALQLADGPLCPSIHFEAVVRSDCCRHCVWLCQGGA